MEAGRLGAVPAESQHGTLAWITGSRSLSEPPASPTGHMPGSRGGSIHRQSRRRDDREQDTFTNRKFTCVFLEGGEHNLLEVKRQRLSQLATGRSIGNWKGCVLLDPIPGSKWAWEVCTEKRVTASS